jgi:hypothetical protein
MPSNAELRREIKVIASELNKKISMKGYTNDQLVQLLSDLKAERKVVTNQATERAEEKAILETKKTVSKKAYFVKMGKAITSKRGILSDGDPIEADDLSGGKEALEYFEKAGFLDKK